MAAWGKEVPIMIIIDVRQLLTIVLPHRGIILTRVSGYEYDDKQRSGTIIVFHPTVTKRRWG